MAQYTRVNIAARRKVLYDAKNLLDDNIKNLTITNKTQEYLEMFFWNKVLQIIAKSLYLNIHWNTWLIQPLL